MTRKAYKRKLWTEQENSILIEMFADNYTSVICDKLNRSYSSVSNQAEKLKLKKSDNFMQKFIERTKQNILIHGEKHRFVKGQEAHNKGVSCFRL